METEVMFSQQTDVWGTPQWLFDALHKEFGFTLDPCSDVFPTGVGMNRRRN